MSALRCDWCRGTDPQARRLTVRLGRVIGQDGREEEVWQDVVLCPGCALASLPQLLALLEPAGRARWLRRVTGGG